MDNDMIKSRYDRLTQEAKRAGLQALLSMLLLLVVFSSGAAQDMPPASILRFTDIPEATQETTQLPTHQRLYARSSEQERPMSPADAWLKRNGWKRVWPRWPFGSAQKLSFAGAAEQRYLRLEADQTYYIWSRPFDLDPHQLPYLSITWGVDRFPDNAALDIKGRNDRPIVVMVSFGPRVPSPGLRPDVPRALAFFWGENATVGDNYTCIPPRHGPKDVRMQCTYPHVKYIALRRANTGSVHTDQVNLVDAFRQHFPDYQKQHQRVPPIVAVSFEARSDRTGSRSLARLYSLAFTATGPQRRTARVLSPEEQ
jgi:hypothetical protein